MSQAEAMEASFQNNTVHSRSSEGQEATKKRDVLAHINKLYLEIGNQSNIPEEAQIEVGRWVNILSYVSDNVIDVMMDLDKAYDYVQRASIAIKSASNKDKPSLALSREIRHEIVMDIFRTDDWLPRLITKITNGSPSVTVVFGVVFSTVTFIVWRLSR